MIMLSRGDDHVFAHGVEASFLSVLEGSLLHAADAEPARARLAPGHDVAGCHYNASVREACGNTWSVTLSDFIDF